MQGCSGFFFFSPFHWEASAHLLAFRVMSHPSAAKRLGYMLPWKCTSCVIIRYSGPNGAHPLSYLVNMSHLICAASRPCATPAEGAGERASEWVSVECGTQYCMWTWTLACIYLKACPLWTLGTRLGSRGGTDANASWFWEMKEGHVTWRDEIGAEEISGSETHLQPRHCQGWRVGSSILFYFLFFDSLPWLCTLGTITNWHSRSAAAPSEIFHGGEQTSVNFRISIMLSVCVKAVPQYPHIQQ